MSIDKFIDKFLFRFLWLVKDKTPSTHIYLRLKCVGQSNLGQQGFMVQETWTGHLPAGTWCRQRQRFLDCASQQSVILTEGAACKSAIP